jgi:hypothetical protein
VTLLLLSWGIGRTGPAGTTGTNGDVDTRTAAAPTELLGSDAGSVAVVVAPPSVSIEVPLPSLVGAGTVAIAIAIASGLELPLSIRFGSVGPVVSEDEAGRGSTSVGGTSLASCRLAEENLEARRMLLRLTPPLTAATDDLRRRPGWACTAAGTTPSQSAARVAEGFRFRGDAVDDFESDGSEGDEEVRGEAVLCDDDPAGVAVVAPSLLTADTGLRSLQAPPPPRPDGVGQGAAGARPRRRARRGFRRRILRS